MSTVGSVGELAESDVLGLCLDQQASSDWPDQAGAYEVVNSWTSRTAHFYRCRGLPQGSPDVVAKVVGSVPTESLVRTDASLRDLGALLPQDGAGTRVPSALGYTEHPSILWMTYVPGRDTSALASDRAIEEGMLRDRLRAIAERAGETLALFHVRSVREVERPGAYDAVRAERMAHARKLAVLAGHGPRRVARLWPDVPIRPRFGDFGIYNFRIEQDGACYLVDPPDAVGRGPVHLDVAWFLFGMDALLHRRLRPRLGPNQTADLQQELRTRFLQGYAPWGPVDLAQGDHLYLVSLYEFLLAIRKLRKRVLQGRLRDARYYGGVVMRVRGR